MNTVAYPNVKSLIAQSINTTSIIRAPHTAELETELSEVCDGSANADDCWASQELLDALTGVDRGEVTRALLDAVRDAAQAVATYTYSIYDSDPNVSGGTVWPTHEGAKIEIKADDDEMPNEVAVRRVRRIMRREAAGLSTADGYEAGQKLYALVWDSEGLLVGSPTYELTEDDLS